MTNKINFNLDIQYAFRKNPEPNFKLKNILLANALSHRLNQLFNVLPFSRSVCLYDFDILMKFSHDDISISITFENIEGKKYTNHFKCEKMVSTFNLLYMINDYSGNIGFINKNQDVENLNEDFLKYLSLFLNVRINDMLYLYE